MTVAEYNNTTKKATIYYSHVSTLHTGSVHLACLKEDLPEGVESVELVDNDFDVRYACTPEQLKPVVFLNDLQRTR